MDEYLEYLLQDLQLSIQRAKQEAVISGMNGLGDAGTDLVTSFASYSGVEAVAFPPASRLKDRQLKKLLSAIHQLLDSMLIELVFPANLPPNREYQLLLQQWTQPFVLKLHAFQPLDFCELDMKNCPYGEQFCYCKNFQTDWEDM